MNNISESKTIAPTLFLMCGLPCSGKTTLAKQLENEKKALRLTPDEWMARIVGDGYDEKSRAIVEAIQWEIAARCLTLGINVILDFGFWTRAEREDFRTRAQNLGARVELCYLNVPMEELLSRSNIRNTSTPEHTFHVNEEHLRLWADLFEPPAEDEFRVK